MSSNGNLTDAELSPAVGGVAGLPGEGQLAASGAAAAWNAQAAWALAHHGVHMGCNGSASMYRPYSEQVRLRNYWCAQGACQNAAVPGTSNHGLGTAVDMPLYCAAICDSAGFGWSKVYSDAPWESWHRHYGGTWHGHDPGAGGGGHRDPTPLLHQGMHGGAVKRAQKHLGRWNIGLTRPHIDGDFGPTTRRAVVQFQIAHNLHPDGRIGDATWKKLRLVDHFLSDERLRLNRIAILHARKKDRGLSKRQRQDLKQMRKWCGHRAKGIAKLAHKTGWTKAHRRGRFHALKRASGTKG